MMKESENTMSPQTTGLAYQSAMRLSALLQSVRAMYEARSSTAVRGLFEQHMLALILEWIPANRGTILLEEQLAGHALAERLTRERGSFIDEGARCSTVVTPLVVRNEVSGAIFLERDCGSAPFSEPDLQLISAISAVASVALENAFQVEWLESEVHRLERNLNLDQEMAGQSACIVELRKKIAKVAQTEATVLILGESGTGKELVARSIHRNSARAARPFVAINCAALTETLLESELFGHERGAFTGAIAQKRGRLECSDGGTVFLDEIGEMPIGLQAKLLRVLQNHEFERVGGTRTIHLDARIVAATNRNLEEASRKGTFRQDLYYRLNVISLRTPALRERPEDIVPLANLFAAAFGEKCGRRIGGISPDARSLLRKYEWPGNVRELENAIERAAVLGVSDLILAEDLPDSLREKKGEEKEDGAAALQTAVNAAKRAAVVRAYEASGNDHNRAAEILGVHPNYLYRLIRNLEMSGLVRGF
jgi:two-component system response regulator HydG